MNEVTTLPNGIILDKNTLMCSSLNSYANKKGQSDLVAFVATHPNTGYQEYVLVEYDKDKNGEVVYATQSAEQAAVMMDILSLIE